MAAGHASHGVVYEAAKSPGGICASYYMRPGERARLASAVPDGGSYRFEIGGGHWMFGGDPSIVRFVGDLVTLRRYERRSAVFLSRSGKYIDYPLQDNLKQLEPDCARSVAAEMKAREQRDFGGLDLTQKDWLTLRFGSTLCELFFHPFNERYTAGLCGRIAPQDNYKSPSAKDVASTLRPNGKVARGYNAEFVYPVDGLDTLARRLAETCRIEYAKRAISIDPGRRTVAFEDGTSAQYETLISTLPLNETLRMAGLDVEATCDPHTAALILNIGATSGPALPEYHWVYVPDASAGFHRVGFYSNVDRGFVPRGSANGVGLYVERAYPAGAPPSPAELDRYADLVIEELRHWGFIDSVEVVDPSWIDIAYTWTWPGSLWRAKAFEVLEAFGIHAAGRYGRWAYQGMADSIRDGLSLVAALGGH